MPPKLDFDRYHWRRAKNHITMVQSSTKWVFWQMQVGYTIYLEAGKRVAPLPPTDWYIYWYETANPGPWVIKMNLHVRGGPTKRPPTLKSILREAETMGLQPIEALL